LFADLQFKKEVQFSYHAHSEFFLHAFCKFLTKSFVSTIEYNIINIYFYKQDILPVLFVKKMVLILPILKPLSIRKDFNISYHALGACKE
jgi:hypothetical protein